ncbi:MAG: DUF1559 domain-containing protein [Pirellulales bacterium]
MLRNCKRRSTRTGFTLVEMLVVIAIIGMLVALLLPAVQAARESGRQASCSNKLRQIALAVHTFESAKKELPSSTRPPGNTPLPRISWVTRLLPQLEQDVLHANYDTSKNWGDLTVTSPYIYSNRQISQTYLPVLNCPSTPNQNRLDIDPQTSASNPTPDRAVLGNWNVASSTDYSPIVAVSLELAASTSNPPIAGLNLVDRGGDGILAKNKVSRLSDVKDGLSNTIMFGESAGRPYVFRLGRQIGTLTTNSVNGGGWARPASDYSIEGSTLDGTTDGGPCAINCTNGWDSGALSAGTFPITGGLPTWNVNSGVPQVGYNTEGTGETYAFHPAGAYHAFGDGSVKLLSSDINIRVYAKLVTRAAADAQIGTDQSY